jgi:hypothetical protein
MVQPEKKKDNGTIGSVIPFFMIIYPDLLYRVKPPASISGL